MQPKKHIIKWSPQELRKFREFITRNSGCFHKHIYKNLLNPVQKVRRQSRIIIKMHEIIGKSTEQ